MSSSTLNSDGLPVVTWEAAEEEAARARWRRRIQQRRCLACASPALVNQKTGYFCAACFGSWRWCPVCETLRPAEAHGRDSRCKPCANARATAAYSADPDRALYRHRLRAMAGRQHSRADQIFEALRRRIALAALVAATPGLSWRARGRLSGRHHDRLRTTYLRQCRGDIRDQDVIDAARNAYWRER
jgi:hypothetical protein